MILNDEVAVIYGAGGRIDVPSRAKGSRQGCQFRAKREAARERAPSLALHELLARLPGSSIVSIRAHPSRPPEEAVETEADV